MKRIHGPILWVALAAGSIVAPLAAAADEGQDKTTTPASAEPRKGADKAAAPAKPDARTATVESEKAAGQSGAAKDRQRISEEDARKSALASVPDSTVRRARTTVYFGKPVWSIDLKPEKSTRLMNVQVDAYSGRVVSKRLLPPGATGGRDRPPTKSDLAP